MGSTMKTLPDEVVNFLHKQNFVIVSTIDKNGHPRHPEAHLPKPKYMIVMEVEEIVDLTPGHIK